MCARVQDIVLSLSFFVHINAFRVNMFKLIGHEKTLPLRFCITVFSFLFLLHHSLDTRRKKHSKNNNNNNISTWRNQVVLWSHEFAKKILSFRNEQKACEETLKYNLFNTDNEKRWVVEPIFLTVEWKMRKVSNATKLNAGLLSRVHLLHESICTYSAKQENHLAKQGTICILMFNITFITTILLRWDMNRQMD